MDTSNPRVAFFYAKDFSRPFFVPERGSTLAAGLDLKASIEHPDIVIPPGERRLIKTNLCVELPKGTYGRIAPRSGLAYKNGIDVLAGVIDADYRGEVGVILLNTDTRESFVVKTGDRIAQMIIEPYLSPNIIVRASGETTITERGEGGFGSTGVR